MDSCPSPFHLNQRILSGREVLLSQWLGTDKVLLGERGRDRVLAYPGIGIFTGTGASHSWLWFVDLFEGLGFYDLHFLDEHQIQAGEGRLLDCLAISGGDTMAMARGLGPKGAEQIKSFIEEGGLYIGSCAGAYLPLCSSKEHLSHFNFVPARITNLTREVSVTRSLPEKSLTPYGCSFVFHPVREEVELTSRGLPPLTEKTPFRAPLYGGPGLMADDPAQVLACYAGFTPKTRFLVDPDLAEETLLGKAAVIRHALGQGRLYLFGPHFEHPHFPLANKIVTDVIYWECEKVPGKETFIPDEPWFSGLEAVSWMKRFKREISNARIVAVGLENHSLQWLLGNKIYEPVKIRLFLEAVWKRILRLEKHPGQGFPREQGAFLPDKAEEITSLLRRIKRDADQGSDTLPAARALFPALQEVTRRFLGGYFLAAYGRSNRSLH